MDIKDCPFLLPNSAFVPSFFCSISGIPFALLMFHVKHQSSGLQRCSVITFFLFCEQQRTGECSKRCNRHKTKASNDRVQ